ncbi:MAG: metal-dependent hydrolase [Candidatus Zhuqueibacterota bacterium]
MPTPIGHSLISTAIYTAVTGKEDRFSATDFAVFLFLGVAPDLDFVPGLLVGAPSRYHHGLSHSVGMSVLVGLLFGLIYYAVAKKPLVRYWMIFSLIYFAHVAADFFAVDTSPPIGEQLFWPFWTGYVLSPITFFLDVQRSGQSADFFVSIFKMHNLKTVILEFILCFPLIPGIWLLKKNNCIFNRLGQLTQ